MDANAPQPRHNVDTVVQAVAAKLHARTNILEQADDSFVLEIHKKGNGYDVKLKTTV